MTDGGDNDGKANDAMLPVDVWGIDNQNFHDGFEVI
jgi:hypothetical protein